MSDRGYGPVHRRIREYLLATIPSGHPCAICGTPMYPGQQDLELHHSDPARKEAGLPGDVLAHQSCNRAVNKHRKQAPPPEPEPPAESVAKCKCSRVGCDYCGKGTRTWPGDPGPDLVQRVGI